MADVARLPDTVVLWRRFNVENPAHIDAVAVDEGTGDRILKGGALRFDEDGCSVYREDVLAYLGKGPVDICETGFMGLAAACSQSVVGFASGCAEAGTQDEFKVVDAAIDPQEQELGPAHALITQSDVYRSKTKRRQAVTRLARSVFRVELT